jgi:hypothetical protein
MGSNSRLGADTKLTWILSVPFVPQTSSSNAHHHAYILIGAACTTMLNISMAFGGKLWPIAPADMNLGTVNVFLGLGDGGSMCIGGIFDWTVGHGTVVDQGKPSWVIGDTFLVSI